MVSSAKSELFIALDESVVVGCLEIHKVPRLRKAKYYGEIESLFVQESLRGSGVAKDFMKIAIR